MNNGFIDHDFFKKYLCRSRLCVMCFPLVCIVLVMYICNNFQTNSQLIYQNIEEFVTQTDFSGDKDTILKLEKANNEAEQKVKLPDRPGDVNENKISSQKENNEKKENQYSNQDTNQQKVVKLRPDNPGKVIENQPPMASQRDNNQQKKNGRLDQLNQIGVPGMNATHINGILLEPVNAKYTRNIYFTMKTTHKYYTKRLFLVMLTWLQVLDKNKLSIISDESPNKNYVDTFRRAGFQIVINDECKDDTHSRRGLCCKMGTEFAAYYNAVEEHPGEEERYQWFCHSDDDVYVNVPKLSRLLQQYDPHKPYYVGKWLHNHHKHPIPVNNETAYYFSHDRDLPLKQRSYQYATGSTFCISYALMMEAKNYLNGAGPFSNISLSTIPPRADDMTVGFIIGALLGQNLTDVANITSQFDVYVEKSSLLGLTRYFAINYVRIAHAASLGKLASSLKTPLPSADPTKLLLYHCLLYPTVSWCDNIRETLPIV